SEDRISGLVRLLQEGNGLSRPDGIDGVNSGHLLPLQMNRHARGRDPLTTSSPVTGRFAREAWRRLSRPLLHQLSQPRPKTNTPRARIAIKQPFMRPSGSEISSITVPAARAAATPEAVAWTMR